MFERGSHPPRDSREETHYAAHSPSSARKFLLVQKALEFFSEVFHVAQMIPLFGPSIEPRELVRPYVTLAFSPAETDTTLEDDALVGFLSF